MKKYAFILVVFAIGLISCGDDDKPVVPELNKLTKVTCNKNGSQMFAVDINYMSGGQISSMQFGGGDNLSFVYLSNKFKVTNLNDVDQTAEYDMSGNVIVSKSVSKKNPYLSNEVYLSDEYKYNYRGADLYTASWTTRWPKAEGGYEVRSYPDGEIYSWEGGNAVLFTQDKKEMKYEYSSQPAPKNFPLRVIPSFNPTGFDIISPINLMYGNQNRNLPERSYSYTIPNDNGYIAEYTYLYNIIGDYITGMTIHEKINPVDGAAAEENSYEYTFTYNFDPNK